MNSSILKKLFSFIVLGLFISGLSAQKSVVKTLLHLNDGSVLYGSLIQENTDHIIWEMTDGNQINIQEAQIKKIELIPSDVQVFMGGQQREIRGQYGVLIGGAFFSKSDNPWRNQRHAPSINASTGYRFHPWLAVGAGLGFDNYEYHMIPVFAEIRGDLLNRAITPYYQLAVGYGWMTRRSDADTNFDYEGGLLMHPALGIKFNTRNRNAFLVEFGYRIQRYKREWNRTGQDIKPERWVMRRAAFRVGMEF